jgi:hypothetical protein
MFLLFDCTILLVRLLFWLVEQMNEYDLTLLEVIQNIYDIFFLCEMYLLLNNKKKGFELSLL